MTTIAFDGKTMACDTRVVHGSNCYNTDTKIYENDFVVIGVSGAWWRSCCLKVRHQHRRQDYYQTTIRIIPNRAILQLLHT